MRIGIKSLNSELIRKKIFSGDILKIPTSEITYSNEVKFLLKQIHKNLGRKNVRSQLNSNFGFKKLQELRIFLKQSEEWISLIRNFFLRNGLSMDFLFDEPKIRIIFPEGHLIPEAKEAYYVHRDTWYGNSESQINLWIPLNTIDSSNGFYFYPNFFKNPIPNNSENFSLDQFLCEGGFQGNTKPLMFPTVIEEIKQNKIFYCLEKGDILCFSAAHLHGTGLNISNYNRISIEIRLINKLDIQRNIGALNIDNKSIGEYHKFFHKL
jgi:hypothetical protein